MIELVDRNNLPFLKDRVDLVSSWSTIELGGLVPTILQMGSPLEPNLCK